MRTSQSFGVHFTVKKDKVKDGIACVYAVITINKDEVIFALKQRVNVEQWDKGHGGLKAKVPEANKINAYLEQVNSLSLLTISNCNSTAKRSPRNYSKLVSLGKTPKRLTI